MSNFVEITDKQQARHFLLETWGLARADRLTPQRLRDALRIALELANEGQPVVPLGLISDVVVSLSGFQLSHSAEVDEVWSVPVTDASQVRRYEDYVLGKFAADMSLERAADELQKYKGRDRDRALAFVIQQLQLRSHLPCFLIGPATIKALLSMNSTALQNEYDSSLSSGTKSPFFEIWDELIQAVRNSGELLGAEDIFELASGTALSKFGQRLALRHVMQAAQHLMVGLPKQKPSGIKRHYSVATNILEEDLYPVGGFSSIANRGTIESLLRSELAYMETDDRPDLFDIKYARDELLYYSRDENQFFRRRVTVMFVLDPSLVVARVKESGQSWQRIVLTMAVMVAMVKTLTDWLASDALKFEIAFLCDTTKLEMQDEWDVLELIFRDEIQAGRLALAKVDEPQLRASSEDYSRQSLCHAVRVHAHSANNVQAWLKNQNDKAAQSVWQPLHCEFSVAQTMPTVAYDNEHFVGTESDDPWRAALRTLLTAINF